MRSLLLVLSALFVLLSPLATRVAEAQSSNVIVLGLTSIEGDDVFATNLSGALRQSASQVRGWAVSDRDVTLSQLEFAAGCDATELSCIQEIATTVAAQRLVYGTIQRNDLGGGRYEFLVRVHLYDAASQSVLRSVEERFPAARTDIDDLRDRARRVTTELATGAGGQASASDVGLPPEGTPVGDVGAADQGERGAYGSSGAPPATGGGGDDVVSRLNWPGFALLGVGVLSAVGWIVAGLDAQANMETVQHLRDTHPTAPPGATNLSICNEDVVNHITAGVPGQAEKVQGACDSLAEPLQFVFMGATIIAGVTGAALLGINGVVFADESGDTRATLEVQPSFSQHGGSLQLRLTY